MSGVEASEGALRQLIDSLQKGREIAAARLLENESEIHRAWETAGKPGTDPIKWAESEANRAPNAFDGEIAALDGLQAAYSRLTDYPERFGAAEQILSTAETAVSVATRRVEEAIQGISQDATEMVTVLEAARDYLVKNPSPLVCPVCESSERASNLAERIGQRLADFAALQTAQRQLTAAEESFLRAQQQLDSLRQNASGHTAAFENYRASQVWPNDIQLPSSSAPSDASMLRDWLKKTSHLRDEWQRSQANRYDKKQSISNLRKALDNWRENTQAQSVLDRLLPNLRNVLAIMVDERPMFHRRSSQHYFEGNRPHL